MKLKAYLAMTGKTAQSFSKEVGVSHTAVNNWINGESKPRRAVMKRIRTRTDGKVGLAAFGLPKNYLNSR